MENYAMFDQIHALSGLFSQYLDAYGLRDRYLQARLSILWPRTMGDAAARYTSALRVKNAVVYVGISSSALRWELCLQKEQLLLKMNETLGEKALKRLVFQ